MLENGVLASEREIAHSLRISPSTLSFKLRKFEDSGVIINYKYRVDFSKIGLGELAWVFCRINYGNGAVKEAMQKLLEYPQVHVCLLVSGEYNICLKVYGEDRQEIENFTRRLASGFHGSIEHGRTYFAREQIKGHNQIMKKAGSKKNYEFDETDLKILSEKMLSPKMSLSEAAQRLRMHRNTVRSHWARMLEGKVIVKKTPIINPDLHREMGIYMMGVMLLRSVRGKEEKLAGELAALNEVHELNLLENTDYGYNLIAILRTNDLAAFYKITTDFYSDKRYSSGLLAANSSIILSSDSRRHTYIKDIGMRKLVADREKAEKNKHLIAR